MFTDHAATPANTNTKAHPPKSTTKTQHRKQMAHKFREQTSEHANIRGRHIYGHDAALIRARNHQ